MIFTFQLIFILMLFGISVGLVWFITQSVEFDYVLMFFALLLFIGLQLGYLDDYAIFLCILAISISVYKLIKGNNE